MGFDLPASVTQEGSVFSFGHDGDEKRIHEITPAQAVSYRGEVYPAHAQGCAGADGRVRATGRREHAPQRVRGCPPGRAQSVGVRGGNRCVVCSASGQVKASLRPTGGIVAMLDTATDTVEHHVMLNREFVE